VKILDKDEIEAMKKVCRVRVALSGVWDSQRTYTDGQLSREVLDATAAHIRPGITTDELDRICHEECIKRDAYPSPLNYNGFLKSVCTSVNEVICHVSSQEYAVQVKLTSGYSGSKTVG
jgi:methionyl aminopeptidase